METIVVVWAIVAALVTAFWLWLRPELKRIWY